MNMTWVQRILPILIFSILTCVNFVIAGNKSSVVTLNDGVNYIDINNDGRKDMVIKSWYENNNAHGYYMYLFLINNPEADTTKHPNESEPEGYQKPIQWLIAPFEGAKGDILDSLHSFQGADCVLHDIHLRRDKDRKFEIIIANRPLVDNFAEEGQKVTFSRYEFVNDNEGLAGFPPFRFVYKDKVTTRRPYCDANEAFEKEYDSLVKPRQALPKKSPMSSAEGK